MSKIRKHAVTFMPTLNANHQKVKMSNKSDNQRPPATWVLEATRIRRMVTKWRWIIKFGPLTSTSTTLLEYYTGLRKESGLMRRGNCKGMPGEEKFKQWLASMTFFLVIIAPLNDNQLLEHVWGTHLKSKTNTITIWSVVYT